MFYRLVKKTEAPIQRSKLSKKRTLLKFKIVVAAPCLLNHLSKAVFSSMPMFLNVCINNSNSDETDEILSCFFSSNKPKLTRFIKLS